VKIAVGCDHRGLQFKQYIIKLLGESGHESKDFGCYNEEAVDYPDIAIPLAQSVAEGEFDCGILICGSGIGMSIAANKVKGIRAALCRDGLTAKRARQHNDANVLCLRTEDEHDVVCEVIDSFMNTEFEGGRHQRRLDKIKKLEN